ncbi:MAG: DUF971 domain-containing protein [Planctomycetes bacterium]|nr:DUF971 domain-containing protein [Planctomycetota bacterium]
MIEPVRFEQPSPNKVRITWRDKVKTTHAARALRLECPCASCVDELTGRKILDPDSVPSDVGIVDADIVGRYAFRFTFSDGHATGLYAFDRLRAAGDVVDPDAE